MVSSAPSPVSCIISPNSSSTPMTTYNLCDSAINVPEDTNNPSSMCALLSNESPWPTRNVRRGNGSNGDETGRSYHGLALNWFAVGFLDAASSNFTDSLFIAYLGYEGYQRTAIQSLIRFPWHIKFFLGFLSDGFPIRRQRRKPYMHIGWSSYFMCMMPLILMKSVEPFGRHGELYNPNSRTEGYRFVIPFVGSSIALLIATAACEGMMVEFAQREEEADRGKTQLKLVFFRFLGEMASTLFVSLACNGPDYGGVFASSLEPRWVFTAFAAISLLGIASTYFFVQDITLLRSRPSIGSQMRQIWRFLEQRVTWCVMVFCFITRIAFSLYVHEADAIPDVWLHANWIDYELSTMAFCAGNLLAVTITYWRFLNAKWRLLFLGCTMTGIIVALPVELLTVFDWTRNLTLWIFKEQLTELLSSLMWVARWLLIVEVTMPGYEATSYDILTTVCNLGDNIARWCIVLVSADFTPESTDLTKDTSVVRWHIANSYLCIHSLKALAIMVCLPIIPRDKQHLRDARAWERPNLLIPVVLMLGLGCVYVAVTISNILSMIPSTMCLRFAGGLGCNN